MIQTIEMLSTAVNATGAAIQDITPGGAFQATIIGTGAISCTVTIQASLDATNWLTLGTIALSGTTSATDGFSSIASWSSYRAVVTAATGIISSIRVNMSQAE